MNDRERLLAESIAGHDGGPFARIAAAHARRRRMLRRSAVTGAGALALAAGFLSFHAPPAASPPASVQNVSRAQAVEILSDEELLRELRGLPVLVLRDASGITGVVFLEPAPGTRL